MRIEQLSPHFEGTLKIKETVMKKIILVGASSKPRAFVFITQV
jgi:hypothetical protein